MRDDGEPGQTGDRDTPTNVRDFKPAKQNGTRIRGTHQGQRDSKPHKQAGHKTAPDHLAGASKSPCNAGAIHTGHSAHSSFDAKRTGQVTIDVPCRKIRVTPTTVMRPS